MSVCCFEALRTSSSFHSIPLQLLSKLTAPSDEVRWIHPHLHCCTTTRAAVQYIDHLPAPVEDVSGALSASVWSAAASPISSRLPVSHPCDLCNSDRLQKAFEDARPRVRRVLRLQETASVCDPKCGFPRWLRDLCSLPVGRHTDVSGVCDYGFDQELGMKHGFKHSSAFAELFSWG
ncbi:uncharacterized protein PGTG_15415 [Puccinia graminis f. sp. tritici CRL 75-36-700-3]|uniref:Uncharacterized protein n=1 Tax=Puccinia graminis f. sp. tritici (strain CRL 75-36-700-3 / race SCCL) TaxID=418459 RepID=E3KZN4_PUCGT|nr:uncharacterized protein PGTG_15415 [Puccinia graminis f. sp. tritici CRL 75-36-700-3]EFP89759.2 hypothetical protein PGTG_15415 [Puccinia graminis f. sp. tritici CRL 75-36-700-3]